nr:DotH/IcmK family type IV secretion protein [Klebsiella variicola]
MCWLYSGSAVFTIQPTNAYASGNITVLLKGLATPVIINVKGAEPSVKSKTVDVDYRLISVSRSAVLTHRFIPLRLRKISLYDKQLQSVLDGIPPEDAQRLKLKNAPWSTKVWQIGDELYVRSNMQLQDEFENAPLSMAHMFTCCRQHQC